MKIPSKQTIVEIASTSGNRDILYSYVATENDHTVDLEKKYTSKFSKMKDEEWKAKKRSS